MLDHENVPGTDTWFPVPKGYDIAELHEQRIKEFADAVMKGKVKLPNSGTIIVTKFENQKYAAFFNHKQEYERWHLNFQIDLMVDEEYLSQELATMMEELTNASPDGNIIEGQEDKVEFDIQFVQ